MGILTALKATLGRCDHPAHLLAVQKPHTSRPCSDSPDEDYNIVTYHLFCQLCDHRVDISSAQLVGGFEAFQARLKARREARSDRQEVPGKA